MHAKVHPGTNIPKKAYREIVDDIEHDPLIKHSTLSVACMMAASCVLLGALLWFAKTNPGNLVKTNATITNISSGRTDAVGTVTTFITYEFKTREDRTVSVRNVTNDGLTYSEGQNITIGYHPANANFARNLYDNRPPSAAKVLWIVPFIFMIWFIFVALFRHHARQLEIWKAAEAADTDD
ncbi:MAG: DUF3592 domain-containing protein [bacterium]|nr:DUF3592 domain-containing protein [bacterium]